MRKRFFHPLLWGAAVLAKKTVMYKAAGTYGWPRIYKRLREQTNMHVADRDTRKHVDRFRFFVDGFFFLWVYAACGNPNKPNK